ncbi:hypothetical protein D3C80_2035980 [compost metagenome]
MQQTVAGKEISVGDNHFTLRAGQHFQIVTLNIITVIVVIAPDKQRLRLAGLAIFGGMIAPTLLPPPARLRLIGQVFQLKL